MGFISFLYPNFIFLLFLIPIFVLIYIVGIFFQKKRSLSFPNFEAMKRIYDVEFLSKDYMMLYSMLVVLALIIFSLAGTVIHFNAEGSDFSYVIAIDNSGSMSAIDLSPNRLSAAKDSAKKFVDFLPQGSEVGIISFAGSVNVVSNLDNSKLRTKFAIDSISFGEVSGTNIYSAIIASNQILGENDKKAVIIISDGQFNIGDIENIIKYGKSNNLVIHSLLIGTESGGMTNYGTTSQADANFSKAMSFNTGGESYFINNQVELDEALNNFVFNFQKNLSLDISFYLLLIALLILTINWIFLNIRLRFTNN